MLHVIRHAACYLIIETLAAYLKTQQPQTAVPCASPGCIQLISCNISYYSLSIVKWGRASVVRFMILSSRPSGSVMVSYYSLLVADKK